MPYFWCEEIMGWKVCHGAVRLRAQLERRERQLARGTELARELERAADEEAGYSLEADWVALKAQAIRANMCVEA